MNKESDFAILMKLFRLFARNNRSTIIVSLILSIVDGFRPYIPIVLSGLLIDGLATGKDFATLLRHAATGLVIILIFQMLSAWLREYFNARIENCLERQNRDMNEQSLVMDYENLGNPELQEKKRKQEQVVNIRGGIYWMIIWPFDRGLTGFFSVVSAIIVAIPLFSSSLNAPEYGFWGSNWLNLVVFALLGLNTYASYITSRRWNKKTKKAFEEYASHNKVSKYFLQNILFSSETAKDLRIFKQEELVKEGIFGKDTEARSALVKMRRLHIQESCIEKTISNICGGFVYLFAALKAYMGVITIGSVVRYAGSIIKCVDGLVEVLFAISNWRQAADYGREYLEYIDFYNRKNTGTLAIEEQENHHFLVEFKNVSFKYPGSDIYILKDFNLKVNIGERLAIVGRNGSGKTTFIKLLCRLYDVTDGAVELNGIDIRQYDYTEYMKLFSVVFQDYRLFSLKIGENIAASETVEQDRALDALKRAGVGERLSQLEDGLDTYIGKEFSESGINFSGGERQKMAIARSIYKAAPFVIMDEPTAALDPVSECEVYEGFDQMVGRKAAIYISHRLASCRFCKDILVFDHGDVVQIGNHDTLIEQEGLYQALWNAQAQYYATT